MRESDLYTTMAIISRVGFYDPTFEVGVHKLTTAVMMQRVEPSIRLLVTAK
jgi:hypothetical protein